MSDLSNKPVLSINEAAELTGLSPQTMTRMFEDVPGVIIIDRPETMHKRRHRTIRIPRAVFDRVLRKVTN